MTVEPAPESTALCLNCGAPLTGAFCAACGQAVVDLTASTWHVVREAVSDATDLDGRVLRTLRAIASPGLLTREYFRGRRAPYVGPVKLFLIAGAAVSTSWILTRGVDARYYGLPSGGSATAYIDTVVRGLLAAAGAVAVVSWALSRGRRRFLDEAVLALHVVAALAFEVAIVLWIGTAWKLAWGSALHVPGGVPSLLYLLFLPAMGVGLAYVMTAIRRVHGIAWWAAALSALIVAAVGVAVITMIIRWGSNG